MQKCENVVHTFLALNGLLRNKILINMQRSFIYSLSQILTFQKF